jgi:hypothetical protein
MGNGNLKRFSNGMRVRIVDHDIYPELNGKTGVVVPILISPRDPAWIRMDEELPYKCQSFPANDEHGRGNQTLVYLHECELALPPAGQRGKRMNETKIVMRESDEAAQLKTVTGWVDRHGMFFGDNERTARWSGCTHELCPGCNAVIPRGWCERCREKADLERWIAAKRGPWDGTTPLYSDAYDKYFFDDDAEEFADDENLTLDDLRLYICEPIYGRPIDDEYFCDELSEDGDVPDGIYEAMGKLNDAIKAAGPLSWRPGKIVPIFEPENPWSEAQ